jgi:hypothetical protein
MSMLLRQTTLYRRAMTVTTSHMKAHQMHMTGIRLRCRNSPFK